MARTGEIKSIILDRTSSLIVRTLIYYDLFDHPLHRNELGKLFITSDKPNFEALLKELKESHLIEESEGYLHLPGKSKNVGIRLKESQNVKKFKKIARFMTSIIALFPYVRAVLISGSLSKERSGKNGDIDFFIITQGNRLYICRSLLTLFKKIFLFNSYKYFCINYFITEDNLRIPENNLYAATETATLIPAYNIDLCYRFFNQNEWIKTYFPGFKPKKPLGKTVKGNNWFKAFIEFVLKGKIGDRLDEFLRQKTLKYRNKKFADSLGEQYSEAFCTDKDCSRHHPLNFQYRTLRAYESAVKNYEKNFNIRLINP